MTDRKKIIEDLEECLSASCRGFRPRESCPYNDDEWDIMRDVLALLKEQEAVKPVLDEQTGRIWLCGKCGTYVGFEDNDPHDPNEFDKYCRECGRPVLWEGR